MPSGTVTATTTTAATSTCTCVSGSDSSSCNSSRTSSHRSSEDGHQTANFRADDATVPDFHSEREDCQRPLPAHEQPPHIIPIFAVSAVTGA
eukprot:scaffold38601_cov18-Tisochrysis_lutea.AAC.1